MSFRLSLSAAALVSTAAALASAAPAQAGCFYAGCYVKSYAHYNQPTAWTSAPVVHVRHHRIVHRPVVQVKTHWAPVTRVVPVTTYRTVTTWQPITSRIVYHAHPVGVRPMRSYYHY